MEYRDNEQLKAAEFALDDIGYNQDFLKLMQNQCIETIHTQETTLEDVFITVTGRNLT